MSNELPCGALQDQTEHAALRSYAVTPEVLLAAQPQVEDWARLAAEGYATVLNLRSDPERAAEQQRNAEAAGLRYLHRPWPAYQLEREHIDELAAIVVLNFISHPVLAAFTTASALIIATGQLKYILGYRVGGERIYETLYQSAEGLGKTNLVTLAIGLTSIALLLFFRKGLRPLLTKAGLKPLAVTLIVSGAPLVTVLLGSLATWLLRLDQTAGVAVVGAIPAGLSPLSWPGLSLADAEALAPTAATIVLVSVVESIATFTLTLPQASLP